MEKTSCFKRVGLERTTPSSPAHSLVGAVISVLEHEMRAGDFSGGDIAVENDPVTGKQVLVWKAERGSKTRQGDGHYRAFNRKAYATENEHFPVRLYLKFASHRPEEMKRPEAPFFLAINHKRKPLDLLWYSRAPLSKNKIGEFLTKAAKNAGLPGNITNHSVPKTCISRLMKAEVPVKYVAQLSGLKKPRFLQNCFWRPPAQDVLVTQRNEISHIFGRCTAL